MPLRAPGLLAAISQEMDELSSVGRASLLFLRRLRCIELLRQHDEVPRPWERKGFLKLYPVDFYGFMMVSMDL